MTDFCIVLPPSPPPKFGAESINPGTNENKKNERTMHTILLTINRFSGDWLSLHIFRYVIT